MARRTLWTIGHSTRSLDELLELLRGERIEGIADVRRYPGSRRLPHFGRDAFCGALESGGIEYRHFLGLGGRREPAPDSPNTAWRSESFRAYADYMETAEFQAAADELAAFATAKRVAVLCAEAVWWRCHRGLLSDRFKVDGWEVLHITGRGRTEPHPYTSAASIVDGRLSYAAPQQTLGY
jgi:uncharacterized protein (DUF488 family)